MKGIKENLKIIIENQEKIITEVLDIKRRVNIIEKARGFREDVIIEKIEEQKEILLEKIDTIDMSIKLIDKMLHSENKPKEVDANEENDTVKLKQCRYNRKGYCKMKDECPFYHSSAICVNFVVFGVCSEPSCLERHPQTCYNFLQSECRWGKRCKYLHREQMIQIIIANDKANENSEKEYSNEGKIVDQINIERKDEFNQIKCKECTKESECIDCIMKKALSDDFLKCDDCTTENACAECEVINGEYLEESIESIMAKAKAFEDEDDNTADLLVDEDCAGTLQFNGAQQLDN